MIDFSNVSYAYGEGNEALHHISFHVQKGETLLLCGESGCGKTTVTRLVNGLIPHYYPGTMEGSVTVAGKNPAETPLYALAETVGSVFQNPKSQFFNVDTTSELAFACENMGMDPKIIRSRMELAAKHLHLEPLLGRSIFDLSGGEKQRIACGSVSMLSPDCIVLDEPTSNLDVAGIHMLREVLSYWKQQGKTVVIAEHRLWFLKGLADRVLELSKGEIVGEMTGTEFFRQPEAFYRERGLRSPENLLPEFPKPPENPENLVLETLSFTYPNGHKALEIPRLEIPMGQVTALVGRNGAGKSTLVSCLCGLCKKDKSTLTLSGKTYSRKQRMQLCFPVMQDVNHQLFTESVLDEVLLSMPQEDEAAALDILKTMDLDGYADTHPMSLSGGQKQRVAIACALASRRPLLILDEPTSGLDLRHMKAVAHEIQRLQTQGRTVLVVTHDAELIRLCCTHVLCLESGKLTEYRGELFA